MVVTTSTTICVSARSGAENQTKVAQVTRPAPPINVIATSRWNFAISAAPTAQTAPMTHKITNAGDADSRSRSPQASGTSREMYGLGGVLVSTPMRHL